MVDIEKLYVTMSTIAVVSEKPPQQISLNEKEFESIMTRPLTIGQSPTGLVVSSQRDQIEAIAGGNKINIRDLSGKTDFSQSRIPAVLDFFIQKSGFQISSYGVNFIASVPCKEPAQWIRDNVFVLNLPQKLGKTILGGAALLNIASEPKRWNIRLDPSDGDTINVDFNASEITSQLPGKDRLCEELREQFSGLHQFLNDLGL